MPVRARSSAWIARDRVLAAVAQRAELVELRVDARRDRRLVAELQRWPLDERRRAPRRHLGAAVPARHERADRRRRRASGRTARSTSGSRASDAPSAASSRGVARPAAALPPSRSTSRTPSSAERERVARACVAHERLDGIEPRVDRRPLDEWREQPLAQQSRAHRRHRAIEHGEQRALRAPAAQRFHQLEVAARHLVERHRAASALDLRTREMRHAAGLQLLQIAQQRARRADRAASSCGSSPSPSSPRTPNCRARSSRAMARRTPSASRSVTSAPSSVSVRGRTCVAARHEHLARCEPREHRIELVERHHGEAQLAGGDVGRGDPDRRASSDARVPEPIAAMKLLRAPSSSSSANATPGETVSTTSRRTIPFATLADPRPARRSRRDSPAARVGADTPVPRAPARRRAAPPPRRRCCAT